MPKAFCHEQTVVIDGETFHLAIDFEAMDATEQRLEMDYDQIVERVQQSNCPIGLMGKVFWGLLRKHHPDISMDEIVTLMKDKSGLTMGLALTQLLEAAFGRVEKVKAKNPPVPRGASKPS